MTDSKHKWLNITVMSIALAVIGIAVTIIAVPPQQWPILLDSWVHKSVFWVVLSALISFGCGFGIRMRPHEPALGPSIISAHDFEAIFLRLVETRQYHTILIFGYTGETVTDFVKFGHLHDDRLRFRILNRNWEVERKEEDEFNKLLDSLGRRPWRKSAPIRSRTLEPWRFKSKREIRMYSERPFVKAVVLVGDNQVSSFVSFYKWDELPQDGGSPFKGAGLPMLHIPGATVIEHEFISNLVSQFECCWKRSLEPGEIESNKRGAGRG